MLNIYVRSLIWLFSLSAPVSAAQAGESILIYVHETPLVDVGHIHITGYSGERLVSADVSRISRDGDHRSIYSVTFRENGEELGNKRISLRYDDETDLDLQSALLFANREAGSQIILEMRGGDYRECYINDEGRDRINVVFELGRVSAYIISYENCEIEIINLD
jgi:hypothetical protein